MHSILSLQSLLFAFGLFKLIAASCQSFGTDYVNGGGPYCVNITSTDYFSFGTEFEGCTAADTQDGTVTPILIDPNSNEYFCSDINTNPDDVNMQSTCNVPGNIVRKNSMISGTWIVVIEGLTFAYMRSFGIKAALPSTVVSTPTLTYSVTSTPTATLTSTRTDVITTTIPAKTVTVPSTTLTKTVTITPAPVTTISTQLIVATKKILVFTSTIKTITQTVACNTKKGAFDPTCTIKVAKATAKASTKTPKIRGRAWAQNMRREAEARGLLEARTLDVCTTTILATTNLPSVTVTVTAPTSTLVIPTDVTSTVSVTPAPNTVYSGVASKTITTTKPTQTITKTTVVLTQTTITSTVWATFVYPIPTTVCAKH